MGDCDTVARILIALGVGLLLLSGLGAAVSWAYAVRVVRATRQVIALRDAYRLSPVRLVEAPPRSRGLKPPA